MNPTEGALVITTAQRICVECQEPFSPIDPRQVMCNACEAFELFEAEAYEQSDADREWESRFDR